MTQYWLTLKIESNDIHQSPILCQEELASIEQENFCRLTEFPLMRYYASGKKFLDTLGNYLQLRLGGQEQERDAHQSTAGPDTIA